MTKLTTRHDLLIDLKDANKRYWIQITGEPHKRINFWFSSSKELLTELSYIKRVAELVKSSRIRVYNRYLRCEETDKWL